MACEICHTRKEKRFCPAVHGRICSICCGEQREVTLDCPSDCIYLQQARRTERPRSIEEIDRKALFPEVDIPEKFVYDREPLLGGLGFALARAARADRSIRDQDVIAALTSLAKSLQTAVNSGLVYEERTANLVQQAITQQLRAALEEYRKLEAQHLGTAALRDSDALRAIVFLLRTAYLRTNGRPKSRAFLDFLFGQSPESKSIIASPSESSRIVVP